MCCNLPNPNRKFPALNAANTSNILQGKNQATSNPSLCNRLRTGALPVTAE
jgi:hypothetical protein